MPLFSSNTLRQVKQVPIAEIVSRYVELKKVGRNLFGLSPFHHEKSASFCIYVDSNRYVDFSGDEADQKKAGGDSIEFVQRIEHVEFNEAVELIAEWFKITVEYEKGVASARPKRLQLYQVYELAAAHFRSLFLSGAGAAARDYWTKERMFSMATAEEFGIGFAATDDGFALAKTLWQKFPQDVLRESGLFFSSDRIRTLPGPEYLHLRYSGRLVIPVHDVQGRVCAFVCRQIPGVKDRSKSQEAKYLNSPETAIFTKGNIVFNLHRARKGAAEDPKLRFSLVEGPTDVMRLWEAGHRVAVAPLGTAITENQLRLLNRFGNGVGSLLDGDDAGMRAAVRLIPMAFATESDVVFNTMPATTDPDAFLRGLTPERARTRLSAVLVRPASPIALAVRHAFPAFEKHSMTAQAKAAAVAEILSMIRHSPSPTAVWFLIDELSRLLQVNQQAIWAEYARVAKLPAAPAQPAASAPKSLLPVDLATATQPPAVRVA